MTIPLVNEWLSGVSNPAFRFFTHLAVALSGIEPWQIDRREIFRSIAFYNYVQKVMPGSRTAPTMDDFVQSEPAFRQVIDKLCPTHIVVCGNRLWNGMPHFDAPSPEGRWLVLSDKEFNIGQYRTANAAPLAMCMRHPQSGFNGRSWYARLQAFLATKPEFQ